MDDQNRDTTGRNSQGQGIPQRSGSTANLVLDKQLNICLNVIHEDKNETHDNIFN